MPVVDIHLNLYTEQVQCASPAPPTCVEPRTTIREVMETLKRDRAGSALICREGVLVGIFTERDALRLMAEPTNWDAAIETVMTPGPVTLRATDTVGEAIQRMSAGRYRHLPIVDAAGKPLGMLKAAGIVHYLVEHFPTAVYNQPPVAHVAMQQREGA
jgi:CBS domain-containing protein